MTARDAAVGLVGEARIRALADQVTDRMDAYDPHLTANVAAQDAIRTAIREPAEACAKVLDERIAAMSAHTNQDGLVNGPDMFRYEIEALTDGAAAIRAASKHSK